MKIPVFHVDAFTDKPFAGNPAAICVLTEWLADETMQKVAMELNLSETAFVVGQQGDYHIRWFTPATEVDFCGHATLAAAHVICRELGYQEGEVNFSSRIGLLTVNQEGSQLCLKGPAMASEAYTLSNELASYLPTEPIEALSNPNQDLMIVMPSQEHIEAANAEIAQLAPKDYRGIILTSQGTSSDFVSRWFGIDIGVIEDPFTGSAHCQLAPYWAQKLDKNQLTARQLSRRGGSCICQVKENTVHLISNAITFSTGTIFL